jgi:ABC-type sugar transport system substrate-binding protein
MALGAAAAVGADHRRRQVAVVGVDGIHEALRAIKRDELSATVAQFPYTMGQLGVEACMAAARDKIITSHIDTPLLVVTKRNVTRVQQSSPVPPGRFNDPIAPLLKK